MDKKRVLSVTQLNMYVKSLLESSEYLNEIYVVGEISNFTNHYKTGHFYMSIKDETGLIKAVMFRGYASKVSFEPKNGMKVICKGKVSLYERDGTYQLYISAMRPEGMGDLQLAYEQLKEKLQKEGLFDSALKRPLPKIPSKIAVITSPTGAAVQDIINILTRRFPVAKVIMCPVQVQGDLAAPQLIEAVKQVNAKQCADIIIIGRGGGSIEDLWAFNSEELARTVRASKIPVISAVGHETDFTICDYASDRRAPTPSAAAELAVPDKMELDIRLKKVALSMQNSLKRNFKQSCLVLESLLNKQCMKNPLFAVNEKSQTLDLLSHRMSTSYIAKLSLCKQQMLSVTSKLDTLSPTSIMLRGYSAVYKDGKIISNADALNVGDNVNIKFGKGERLAQIKE